MRAVVGCMLAAALSAAVAAVETGHVEIRAHEGRVYALAFSPDGRILASGGEDGRAVLWDASRQRRSELFTKYRPRIEAVAFHPGGTVLAVADLDERIILWDLRTGRPACKLKGHVSRISSVAFSSDGEYLASTASDSTAQLWFLRTGTVARTLRWPGEDFIESVAFSPDRRLVAISRARREAGLLVGVAELWDAKTGKLVKTLMNKGSVPDCLTFSPDGKYVLGGCSNSSAPLWEVETGRLVRWHAGHKGFVEAVAILPDNRHFVTAGLDGAVKLWALETGEVLKDFRTLSDEELSQIGKEPPAVRSVRRFWSVAFSSDLCRFATGRGDGVVHVWDLPEGFRLIGAPSQ